MFAFRDGGVDDDDDDSGDDVDDDGGDDDLLATQQSLPAAKIVPFAAPKVEIATERGISQAIGPEIYNVRSVVHNGGGDQLLIFWLCKQRT